MRQLDRIKEFWVNLSGKAKKLVIAVAVGLIVLSAAAAIMFNRTDFTVLFSGMNDEEAQKVISMLHDSGVTYRYAEDGKIFVPSNLADKMRAQMAMEGYPQNGFTYDVLLNNSGLMSTESDKETYKLFDLQDRIGKTIRTFEGVKSAVVTINLAKDSKYVLNNEAAAKSSAYAVVHMNNGGSPSRAQVEGIQRLIAKSVPDMQMSDVAVIDGNGIDVSVIRDEDGSSPDGTKKSEYEAMEEQKLEAGVLNLLESIYGRGNVRVKAKCVADMQKVVSEEITYSAPNTVNNSGYINHQKLSSQGNGPGAAAAGIPGAQSNTNVPQYNTQATAGNNGSYSSDSDTQYSLNQKKVQGQDDSGAITDVSVAVTINKKNIPAGAPSQADIVKLVAKAAGISEAQEDQKITVVTADFYDNAQGAAAAAPPADTAAALKQYLPIMIAGFAAFLLLSIILLLMLRRARKKRRLKKANEAAELESAAAVQQEPVILEPHIPALQVEENKYGAMLKEELQTFADENPEISASLLKSWLRTEDDGHES